MKSKKREQWISKKTSKTDTAKNVKESDDTSTFFWLKAPSTTSISNSCFTSDGILITIFCWDKTVSGIEMYVCNDNLIQFWSSAMTFTLANASSTCSVASNLQRKDNLGIEQEYKCHAKYEKSDPKVAELPFKDRI